MNQQVKPSRIHQLHDLMVELGRLELILESDRVHEPQRVRIEQQQSQLRQMLTRLTG